MDDIAKTIIASLASTSIVAVSKKLGFKGFLVIFLVLCGLIYLLFGAAALAWAAQNGAAWWHLVLFGIGILIVGLCVVVIPKKLGFRGMIIIASVFCGILYAVFGAAYLAWMTQRGAVWWKVTAIGAAMVSFGCLCCVGCRAIFRSGADNVEA